MLAEERISKIIGIIKEKGTVRVDELAKELDVSLMTVRRDLEKLKNEGILERCHGGAILKKEVSYKEKRTLQIDEKIKIAQRCARMVRKGDTVFLDAGTTTYEIAKQIYDIPSISIITNDIEIARFLIDTTVRLILCGGTVQKSTCSMVGDFAIHMMENMRTEIAFIGAASIDDDFNVLTPTSNKAVFKRTVCKYTNRSYLAVDSTKFGKQALLKVNHLSDYVGVVTNKIFSEKEIEKIKKQNINIISI
ncbi:MAG: DeoR/GlpR transcriptional regulator [Clostridiales bacterium]|jgi:DeoR/GlpR family transcriptional regulator of sugar metabolism|nr:DeoR/GlpR transcriptional regulator [Clostridiales bacterium]